MKVFKDVEIPTTNVWFECLREDGSSFYKSNEVYGESCYYIISKGSIEGVTLIKTWIPIIFSPYSEEEVIRWINDLKEMGFTVNYDGIIKQCYHFSVPVDRVNKINSDKTELVSLLILVRYLWERGLNIIPFYYFQILEALDISKFEAMQLANSCSKINANSNHSLRYFHLQTFKSQDSFWKSVKNELYPVDNKMGVVVIYLWQGEAVETVNVEDAYTKQKVSAQPIDHVARYNKIIEYVEKKKGVSGLALA